MLQELLTALSQITMKEIILNIVGIVISSCIAVVIAVAFPVISNILDTFDRFKREIRITISRRQASLTRRLLSGVINEPSYDEVVNNICTWRELRQFYHANIRDFKQSYLVFTRLGVDAVCWIIIQKLKIQMRLIKCHMRLIDVKFRIKWFIIWVPIYFRYGSLITPIIIFGLYMIRCYPNRHKRHQQYMKSMRQWWERPAPPIIPN